MHVAYLQEFVVSNIEDLSTKELVHKDDFHKSPTSMATPDEVSAGSNVIPCIHLPILILIDFVWF